MPKDETKKTRKRKTKVAPETSSTYVAQVQEATPTIPQHLKNIHIYYDVNSKKVCVTEVELDENGKGQSVLLNNSKDVTDEFLNVNLLLAVHSTSEVPMVLHGFSEENDFFVIFHKAPKGTSIESIESALKSI
jgi:hypothetical protein